MTQKFKMAGKQTIPKVQAASAGGALGVVAAEVVAYLLELSGVMVGGEVEMALVTLLAAVMAWVFGRFKRPDGSEVVVADNG